MKIKVSDVNEIRSYIGIAPVIVNGKYNVLTKECCERYFDMPFQVANAVDLVDSYILPYVRSEKVDLACSLDTTNNQKNQGLILNGYREIQCRKYTLAYLMYLLKRNFLIIILDDAGTIDNFPHDGAVYLDWKGDWK